MVTDLAAQERLFDEINISAEPFALCELQGVCSLGLGRDAAATLHYVLAGAGHFLLDGHAPVLLSPGMLLLVPGGRSHSLIADRTGASSPPPDTQPALPGLNRHLVRGTGTGGLTALCARVSVGLRGTAGLTELLREPLAVDCAADPRLRGLGPALLAELSAPGPGAQALIRALLLQGVIGLLRARGGAGLRGWLPLLADARMWPALSAMLDAPGAPHGLERLAALAGMGRSRFAARFQELAGEPPMEVLRRIRMAEAMRRLQRGETSMERIAHAVGFRSRSAFSRAFTRAYGLAPGTARHEAAHLPPAHVR